MKFDIFFCVDVSVIVCRCCCDVSAFEIDRFHFQWKRLFSTYNKTEI